MSKNLVIKHQYLIRIEPKGRKRHKLKYSRIYVVYLNNSREKIR